MKSQKKLTVGVVGTGILGQRHARVFRECENTELVGVADTNLELAKEIGIEYNVPAYGSGEALIEGLQPDIVVVATPDFAHTDLVIHSLQAGAHVLVEKPLTTDIEEAYRIISEQEKANRLVMVNYSQRFVTEFSWIKQTIAQGAIGQPVLVQSEKFDTIYVPTKMLSWASKTTPFFFMTAHDLDLVSWYLESRPVEAYGQSVEGVLKSQGIDTIDGVQVVLRFESGASAAFHSSWIHPDTYPVIAGGSLEIVGTKGFIRYSMMDRRAHLYTQGSTQTIGFGGPHTANEVEDRLAGAFVASVNHFIHCIHTGEEPVTSARRTLHVTATQCSVDRAIRENRVVSIQHK